jgi:hypothetical protein
MAFEAKPWAIPSLLSPLWWERREMRGVLKWLPAKKFHLF